MYYFEGIIEKAVVSLMIHPTFYIVGTFCQEYRTPSIGNTRKNTSLQNVRSSVILLSSNPAFGLILSTFVCAFSCSTDVKVYSRGPHLCRRLCLSKTKLKICVPLFVHALFISIPNCRFLVHKLICVLFYNMGEKISTRN